MRWLAVSTVVGIAAVAAPSVAEARPRHKHCVETSPIVGRSRCRRFGSWSTPRWLPRLTYAWSFGTLSTTLGNDATAFDDPVARTTTPTAEPAIRYAVAGARITAGLGRWLELGYGMFGGWAVDGHREPLGIFGGEVMVVANLPVGRALIRPELALAGRFVMPMTSDEEVAARTPPGESPPSGRAEAGVAIAPRLSVELPWSTWLAAGITVGTELAEPAAVSAGVYVQLRTRSLRF